MRVHVSYQPQRVYQNLVFTTVKFLISVKTNGFSSIAALDAMCVNNQRAGGHFTAHLYGYVVVNC